MCTDSIAVVRWCQCALIGDAALYQITLTICISAINEIVSFLATSSTSIVMAIFQVDLH